MLLPGERRRLRQLTEAALNLGMNDKDARYYAAEALRREMQVGTWRIAPQSAEAQHDYP